MIQVSSSQFDAEARCFRYWTFKSVFGLPEVQGPAQALGTVFAKCMELLLKGEDPFPSGWEGDLAVWDVDTVRRLIQAAREHPEFTAEGRKKIRFVEPEFWLEVLPEAWVCSSCKSEDPWNDICFATSHTLVKLPPVVVLGYPDVVTDTGVDDHKTTKSIRDWAKSPDQLRQNQQLLTYGKAWLEDRRKDGLPDPEFVRVRHHNYDKTSARVETREAHPPLTPQEIDSAWEDRKTQAKRMRDFIVANEVKTDLKLADVWPTIPAAGTPNDARNRKGACGEYRGCPFAPICGGIQTPAEYRAETIEIMESQVREARGLPTLDVGGYMTASIFGARGAAVNGSGAGTATAPPPAATGLPSPPPAAGAPPPAPSAPPPAPAAPPPAASGLPPAPTPQQKKTFAIWPGTFPIARPDCGACVEMHPDGTQKSTGITYNKGTPCRICSNKNQGEGKPFGHQFETEYANGVFAWSAQAEHRAAIEAAFPGMSSGEVSLPWMKAGAPAASAAAPPPAAPPPAPSAPPPAAASAPPAPPPAAAAPSPAPAAPPPAPSAPAAPQAPPAASGQSAPASGQQVGQPSTGQEASPAATGGKTKPVKFILYLDCGPRGGVNGVVRLDAIFAKYSALLAVEEKKDSYWEIPPFVRREKLASAVSRIAEAEKLFSSKYVVGSTGTPDMREFCEAFAAIADEVFVPFGR